LANEEQQKKEIQQKMAEFRDKFKLSSIMVPPEVDKLLSLSREYLKSAPRDELAIDAIRLAQYGLYIKTEANRLRANISWCDANINSIIGRELPNTEGYGLAEKSLIIKRNDIHAKELDSVKSFCEVQLKSIEDIDRKIEFMSSCLKNLAFEKRGPINERS
jgi:hypothetical protein